MIARALLLAAALLFAQAGALLHGVEHAAHDANLAALDHEVEKCVAYDALGHALHGSIPFSSSSFVPFKRGISSEYFAVVAARIVFDSRAPPYSA